MKFLKERKFKYGAIATVMTVCIIAVVVLFNVIVNILNQKINLQYDVTSNDFFEISEETKAYIPTIDKNIEILVLESKEDFRSIDSEYYNQASNIIDQYPQYSDKISVSYLDLDKHPNIATQYSQDNIKAADIIVRTESDYSVLTAEDLFEGEYSYYSYGYTITASKAEQAITSAILNLTSEEKIKVEFILGYEEEDYTALKSLLEQNNYEVVETKILTSQLSEDAKISIIYGPLYDYDEQGINKLKEHMEKGKSIGRNIVYIASPDAGETPNLNNFLKDWGMSVGSGNVFETDVNNLFSNSVYYTICGYSQNEYTENLKNTSIPVAVPIAKPITMIEDAEVASNELLYFSETAGIIPMGAGNDWQPSESDICGPITASCISTKTEADVKSSVCVVSSTLAFDSGLLLRSSLNNSSYFINLFNSISENENNVIIESKSVEYDMLKINTTQALTIGVILAIIVPIALIVAGIFIWIRRKGR